MAASTFKVVPTLTIITHACVPADHLIISRATQMRNVIKTGGCYPNGKFEHVGKPEKSNKNFCFCDKSNAIHAKWRS